jgi:hypothetical protein
MHLVGALHTPSDVQAVGTHCWFTQESEAGQVGVQPTGPLSGVTVVCEQAARNSAAAQERFNALRKARPVFISEPLSEAADILAWVKIRDRAE